MYTIALDTNFLMCCVKQKIDFIQELERICNFTYNIIIPESVLEELKNIADKGTGKEKEIANITLDLIKNLILKNKIKIKKITERNADSSLLKLDRKNYIIATLDKELRKKLKNAKVLGIKQFKYLHFPDFI